MRSGKTFELRWIFAKFNRLSRNKKDENSGLFRFGFRVPGIGLLRCNENIPKLCWYFGIGIFEIFDYFRQGCQTLFLVRFLVSFEKLSGVRNPWVFLVQFWSPKVRKIRKVQRPGKSKVRKISGKRIALALNTKSGFWTMTTCQHRPHFEVPRVVVVYRFDTYNKINLSRNGQVQILTN